MEITKCLLSVISKGRVIKGVLKLMSLPRFSMNLNLKVKL